MPRKTRKYDSIAYQNVMHAAERKFRNAYYYLERLMELDSEFAKQMTNIRKKHVQKQTDNKQSSKEINTAIEQALQRQ